MKDNQEDYLFPQHADSNTRVFILCDGMGGHDNGEVASKTAAATLGNYLTKFKDIDIPTFEVGLAKAYDALDEIDTNSVRKPGTTMTCLCLNANNYLVAHIGDSRIYHIRPSLFNPKTGRGGILYHSSDHSLVNDLLKAGEITEEEARNFPRKNIITKAMQPHLERRFKADVYEFNDIAPGDYFFLCSDGVLEQISNEWLCKILADSSLDDLQKLNEIKSKCNGITKDNFSCWLIPIESAKPGDINRDENVIIAAEAVDSGRIHKIAQPTILSAIDSENPNNKKSITVSKEVLLDLIVVGLTLIAIIVWIILKLTHALV